MIGLHGLERGSQTAIIARRITYALGDSATAFDLVRCLVEVEALRDISVVEPAIEEVVTRLYPGGAG